MTKIRSIPAGQADLDRYELDHYFHCWSHQPQVPPRRVVSAKGVRFTTADGRELLDFSSCFVSHNVGHQDERVVEAISRQCHQLCSFAPSLSNAPRALLAKTLEQVTPGDLGRTFMTLGGTEANEAAIKICQQYTGKRKVVSRYRSYHGATAASMSLSAGDPRGWVQVPGGAETVRVGQPYCYRCTFGQQYPGCNLECARQVDEVLELEGGGETVAAVLVEPIAGGNGVIVPPPEYFPLLREICDRWGVLMIADEVMTGFGRTGKWFAMDHWDTVPDVMTMAKGMTGGYVPLGAAVVRTPVADRFKEQFFAHGATYAGHALACAAALEVMAIYEEDGLIERSASLGAYLLDRARELQDRHPSVGDVRGLGLFVGLELVRNRATREPIMPLDARLRQGAHPKLEVGRRLWELGLMTMTANPCNVIVMAPPLIATKADIDEGLAMMDQALAAADAHVEQ